MMRFFSLKNLWFRLALLCAVSSLAAVPAAVFHFYAQAEKIGAYSLECDGAKMLSNLSSISHAAYLTASGGAVNLAESRRATAEFLSLSKKIAGGSVSKIMFSSEAINGFIKNPGTGEMAIEVASNVSQQSGLMTDSVANSHLLMEVSSDTMPKIYSDIFRILEVFAKHSQTPDKFQTQAIISGSISLEHLARVMSGKLRRACSMSEPSKSVALAGNIAKFNAAVGDFNAAVSKMWQGKDTDRSQLLVSLGTLENLSNEVWRGSNALLADSLSARLGAEKHKSKVAAGICAACALAVFAAAAFMILSIYSAARRTVKVSGLAAEMKFARAREYIENSPRAVSLFADIENNIALLSEYFSESLSAAGEILDSAGKLADDAASIVGAQKPRVAGVANGFLRLDAKMAMRGKSDSAIAASAQNMRDRLGAIEQGLRMQYNSLAGVSRDIESAFGQAGKLTESLASIRETAKKMSVIAEIFMSLADKANILGLNLAIETAKAGIKGSGLGTLAEQVRTLSERTVVSVIDIESVRNRIVETIDAGSADAEKFLASLEGESKILSGIGGEIESLTAALSKLSASVNSVSVSLRERGAADTQFQDLHENISKIGESLAELSAFTKTMSQEVVKQRGKLPEVRE